MATRNALIAPTSAAVIAGTAGCGTSSTPNATTSNTPMPTTSALGPPTTPSGYGPQTVLPFSGLNHPRGIAVDTAGNVYVTDRNNNWAVKLPAG